MNIKRYVLSILVVVFIFLFDCKVEVTALSYPNGFYYGDVRLECYYANGIVVSYNGNKNAVPTIKDYPLAKTDFILNNSGYSNKGFYIPGHAMFRMQQLECPSSISYFMSKQLMPTGSNGPNGSDTNETEYQYSHEAYYNFSNCTNYLNNCGKNASPIWIENQFNKFYDSSFWFWESKVQIGFSVDVECSGCDATANSKRAEINLVGERVYFVDDFGEGGYGPLYKKVNSDEQAVSSNSYAQFYKGFSSWYSDSITAGKNGPINYTRDYGFLQVGKTTTGFNIVKSDNVDKGNMYGFLNGSYNYICIKESKAPVVNDEVIFSSIRHEVSVTTLQQGCNTSAGWELYEKMDSGSSLICVINADSFCEKYPKTADVLRKIIKIIQLIIPALIIIFTGVELGKLVLSGNIDEEIPKIKKSILIRFIVAVSCFFLPTISALIINIVNDVDDNNNLNIADIGCLFNDHYLDENCTKKSK